MRLLQQTFPTILKILNSETPVSETAVKRLFIVMNEFSKMNTLGPCSQRNNVENTEKKTHQYRVVI
jgi:hypothetical protein